MIKHTIFFLKQQILSRLSQAQEVQEGKKRVQ
jgi:hypothetical protein